MGLVSAGIVTATTQNDVGLFCKCHHNLGAQVVTKLTRRIPTDHLGKNAMTGNHVYCASIRTIVNDLASNPRLSGEPRLGSGK